MPCKQTQTGLSAKDVIGKTISGVSLSPHNDEGLIAFTDGTWLAIRIDRGYEGESSPSLEVDTKRSLLEVGAMAVQACLLSRDEWDRHLASQRADVELRNKEARRRQFERLKQEFE